MGRQEGYLLMEMLLTAFLITVTATAGFGILSRSFRLEAVSSRTIAAAGEAETLLRKRLLGERSLLNPSGLPTEAGTEHIRLKGRRITFTLEKEVSDSCPGLITWTMTISGEVSDHPALYPEEFSFSSALFDPFGP